MFISLQTFDRAIRLVDELTELSDPADFAPTALPALADLIGCDVITYSEVGPAPNEVTYQEWPPRSLDPNTNTTFRRFVHEHPSIEHYRITDDTTPVTIGDFLSTAEFQRLGIYAEVSRPIPVEHQLSISLNDAPALIVGIALSRDHTEFTEVDRAVLGVLRVPLMRALVRTRVRHAASRAAPASAVALSERELEVMRLVSLGRTNAAIAHTMGISPRTVAKHLERTYRKLNVASRAEAVAVTVDRT